MAEAQHKLYFFLRYSGLIPRAYESGNRIVWLSVGIGALQLSLDGVPYPDHIASAEPNGSYL